MNDHSTRAPSRRDFLIMGAGVFTVSALGVSVRRQQLVRRSVPVMGTIAELAVVARDERVARGAIDAALVQLYEVERDMSRFTSTSDIGRANAHAFRTPVMIGAATAAVVAEALRWADTRGSAFDPAIGRIAELWDVAHNDTPPDNMRMKRYAGRRLYRAVELTDHHGAPALVYHDADVGLDLGGIAKGYGVDRAVAALRAWGVQHALVNVGGDLYALGASGDGDPWQIGIRSPADPHALAGTIALRDRAVATSGDYERYFEHNGQRYHHLLDPATAAPRASAVHSLTVAADTCMQADAAATAVYGVTPAVAQDVLAHTAPDAVMISTL